MAEDDLQEDGAAKAADEKVDVKAKMAQMSGFRIREQRRAAFKSENATDSAGAVEPELPAEPEPESVAQRSQPVEQAPAAAPKPEPKRQRAQTPQTDEDDKPLGTPIVFFVGLIAGCAPMIVVLVMGMLGSAPSPGVPPGSVERFHDWIHCPRSTAANQWQCDVYDATGKLSGTGEFVSEGEQISDWRALASQDSLVPHGWYDFKAGKQKSLYVRGVKVGSTSTRGTP